MIRRAAGHPTPIRTALLALCVAGLASLAGCEKSQKLDTSAKKPDAHPWDASDAANPAYSVAGFKAGDKTAWEEQLRKRAQAQNDYVR